MGFLKDYGGAIASFAGNLFGAQAQKEATAETNKQNAIQAHENRVLQETFAKQGLRWKVEDAKAAGLHPLAALGAVGPTASPVAIGHETDISQADLYRNMGQDVSRAINSTRTREEREVASMQIASAKLDLEGKALDNQIRASQLRKMNQVGAAFPGSDNFISGQGDSGLIKNKAQERTATRPGSPNLEPGAVPGVGFEVLGNGAVVPVPSDNLKQKIEDNIFHEAAHFIRNNIMPNFGTTGSRPPGDWVWDPAQQAWVSPGRSIWEGIKRDARNSWRSRWDKLKREGFR